MKNAVITAKLPTGEWKCLFISENITEAKIAYKKIIAEEGIEESSKGYLQFNLFYQPQMRRVSKSGRISESELKAKAKAKADSIKDADKAAKEEEASFQKELEAEERAAKKEANEIAKRQKKEKAAKAKAKEEGAKLTAAKEAAKQEAFAQVVADKMKAKK